MKGLGREDLGGRRGTREISFYDFRECGDVEVVGRVVGDIPGCVEDGAKDFGLEFLDALNVS